MLLFFLISQEFSVSCVFELASPVSSACLSLILYCILGITLAVQMGTLRLVQKDFF